MPSHDVLFERMPARPRVLMECLLVITLFFLPVALLMVPSAALWYALGAGFVGWAAWALALTYRRQLTGSDLPWLVLRSLAALAVVGALLMADGQSARNIGLDVARFPRELLWGAPALAGAFATNLAVAIPIGLVMQLRGGLQDQAVERMGVLQGLAGVRAVQLLPALVVLAALEEVVFRGFLLARARCLSGRWWLAVGLVQLLFGLGHVYEGWLAVVQTMMLGIYFSVVFLWRVHLGAVIVAHTAFNAIMFALVLFIQRSGLFEKLPLK